MLANVSLIQMIQETIHVTAPLVFSEEIVRTLILVSVIIYLSTLCRTNNPFLFNYYKKLISAVGTMEFVKENRMVLLFVLVNQDSQETAVTVLFHLATLIHVKIMQHAQTLQKIILLAAA